MKVALDPQTILPDETPVAIMPLFHGCDCFTFDEILSSESLKAIKCKEFNEELLYFYYGRPAYKVSSKIEENRSDTAYLPTCFICNIANIDVFKIHPFDSGAYAENKFKRFVHHKMSLEQFEIYPSINILPKFIKHYFSSNANYYEGKEQLTCEEESVLWKKYDVNIAEAYKQILSARGIPDFDDRAKSIEVLLKKDVTLYGNVEACILPRDRLRIIGDKLKLLNIIPITYVINTNIPPNRYDTVIFNKAYDYLENKNCF